MKAGAAVLSICCAAALSIGCGYKTLQRFFDGVPSPEPRSGSAASRTSGPSTLTRRPIARTEHGPYAARLCGTCHQRGAANALVVPPDQLCARCHDIQPTRRYVHGPLAAGGCMVCHDPHGSPYRYLLVSDSDDFCFHCHDRPTVDRVPEHGTTKERCTDCHDAHMSDEPYLLK